MKESNKDMKLAKALIKRYPIFTLHEVHHLRTSKGPGIELMLEEAKFVGPELDSAIDLAATRLLLCAMSSLRLRRWFKRGDASGKFFLSLETDHALQRGV